MAMTILFTLAAAAMAQPIESPPTHSQGIEIMRSEEMQSQAGSADYFTGKVTISGRFERPGPSRVTGGMVRFEPGARTAWHRHPQGQTLIVTQGVGWTQMLGGPVLEFRAGDILWCPPNRAHWHGATPQSAMTHIAVQERQGGTTATWLHHVTDAEYLAGPRRN